MEFIAVALLMLGFLYFRHKTGAKWYNLPAIGILVFMSVTIANPPEGVQANIAAPLLILTFMLLTVFLLIDTFYLKD